MNKRHERRTAANPGTDLPHLHLEAVLEACMTSIKITITMKCITTTCTMITMTFTMMATITQECTMHTITELTIIKVIKAK